MYINIYSEGIAVDCHKVVADITMLSNNNDMNNRKNRKTGDPAFITIFFKQNLSSRQCCITARNN